MRGFAIMITVGTGTFNTPIQTCFKRFFLQDRFCERATANVSKAHHQNFHGGKDKRQKVQGSRHQSEYEIPSCFLSVVPCMDFLGGGISLQRIAMTNKEILTAYGAYALRKNYQ